MRWAATPSLKQLPYQERQEKRQEREERILPNGLGLLYYIVYHLVEGDGFVRDQDMPNVEVVANIQDLVSNLQSVIAAQIMADIDRANNFQKIAEEIYSILTSGRLVKPKMSNRKTIAVSDNVATVSGWDSLNSKSKHTIKQNHGISLEQDENKVKEYYHN